MKIDKEKLVEEVQKVYLEDDEILDKEYIKDLVGFWLYISYSLTEVGKFEWMPADFANGVYDLGDLAYERYENIKKTIIELSEEDLSYNNIKLEYEPAIYMFDVLSKANTMPSPEDILKESRRELPVYLWGYVAAEWGIYEVRWTWTKGVKLPVPKSGEVSLKDQNLWTHIKGQLKELYKIAEKKINETK